MKQAIRSQLPKEWLETIGSSRFIATQPNEFGPTKLIAFGDDPKEVAAAGGTLYRVDEAKRSA